MRCHVTITSLRVIALKAAEQTVRSKYGRQSTIGSPKNVPALGSSRPHLSKSLQKGTKTWSRWQSGGSLAAVPHPWPSSHLEVTKRKSNLPHTSRKSSKSRVKISWGLDIWGIQKVATATRSSNLWRVSTWWTAGSLSLTISSPESDWSFRAKITLRLLQNSSVTTSVLRDACYDKERFLWVHHFTLQPTVVKTAVTCQSMIEGPSGRAQVHWDGTWKWLSMFDTWRIHNKDVFLNDSW